MTKDEKRKTIAEALPGFIELAEYGFSIGDKPMIRWYEIYGVIQWKHPDLRGKS